MTGTSATTEQIQQIKDRLASGLVLVTSRHGLFDVWIDFVFLGEPLPAAKATEMIAFLDRQAQRRSVAEGV